MKKLITSFMLMLSSMNLFAGDYSEVRVIAADDQAKYVSFIEYGVQDGSGISYATLRVLDVAKNDYVKFSNGKTSIYLEDETGDYSIDVLRDLRTKAYTQARSVFKKYNISKANMDLVNFLVVNPITEITTAKNIEFTLNPFGGSTRLTAQISTEVDVKATKERCYDLAEAEMLKFSLKTSSGKSYVLQNDKSVPKSRGCAFGYRVHAIVSLSKKNASYNDDTQLVTLIGFQRPGFEGPDARIMATSGTLPSM